MINILLYIFICFILGYFGWMLCGFMYYEVYVEWDFSRKIIRD